MNYLKYVASCGLLFTAFSSHAARDYLETGVLQCSVGTQLTGSPIVLFVNGIGNSLDDAEESRAKIESTISPKCTNCEFKKVYNQEDGFYDDVNELNLVGGWQLKAIDKAAVSQYDYLVKDVPLVFGVLADKGITAYGGFPLANLKSELLSWLTIQRDLAKNGYMGATVRFYNPQEQGSSFSSALISKNTKEIDAAETLFGKSTLRSRSLEVYQAYLNAYKEAIDARFFTEYRSLVVSTYFSDRNLYTVDAAAVGAMTKSVESLVTIINEYVLAGHKVVVIPHSQGNHVIELAYSYLLQQKSAQFMSAIRVVGVASVSSSTPNNIYVTWDEDHTVLTTHSFNGNSPLASNFADESPWYGFWGDVGKDHSFVNVYLSSALKGKFQMPSNAQSIGNYSVEIRDPTKIRIAVDVLSDLTIGSLTSAVPMAASITTNSVLTAQLRWEDYGDMDLHITEPNGGVVYYGAKSGSYGYLDLDDVDGLGPEHYFTAPATKCESLDGKEWRFAIHQYPAGGFKAAVHLMLKVGDSAFLSRSFGLNSWPAQKLDVGSVRFLKLGVGSGPATAVYYEIKISDPNG